MKTFLLTACLLFFSPSDEQVKLEQRRQWLDNEVEKVLKRKQAMEALEEELKKRETIIRNREAMLAEKSELEMKKLRSSQVITKVAYFFAIVNSFALGFSRHNVKVKWRFPEFGAGRIYMSSAFTQSQGDLWEFFRVVTKKSR